MKELRGATRVLYFGRWFIPAPMWTITCDASPWGFGAWLSKHGTPVSFFYDKVTALDEVALGHPIGSHTGQQAFETLCILIAVRVWKEHLEDYRSTFAVRIDYMGAFACFGKLPCRGGIAKVARELALELSDMAFTPQVLTHLPRCKRHR